VAVDRGGGAFAIVRGVDLETGGRTLTGATVRGFDGAGALDFVALGALAGVRGTAFAAGRTATGSGGGVAGVSTVGGAESLSTTVPVDCSATRPGATTGVETAGSVSTVDRAIAVS